MKKIYSYFIAALAFGAVSAQDDTHVLMHLAPEEATEMPNYWGQTSQGNPLWGYMIGHNAYGDEEFGEKYDIDGEGHVVGVMAYLGGTSVSNNTAHFNVYSVAANGLPGDLVESKSFVLGEAATDGTTPVMVMFDSHAIVENEFFVTLNLGDYSHDPLVGDTVCLMSGIDGSRPASDDTFGRTVIRWHSHSSLNWKDFMTQNFTPLSVYFAIYPIMEGSEVVSSSNSLVNEASLSMFPVPFQQELNINFTATDAREMNVRIFNTNGKLMESSRQMVVPGDNLIQLNMNQHAAGSYVVSLESAGYRYARVVTKSN